MAVIDFSALSAYVDQISGKLIKKALTVFEDICVSKFDAYWTQILNQPGSYYEKNPIEVIYTDQKVEAIAKLTGDLLWTGSKVGTNFGGATATAVTGNITLCDGILYDLEKVTGSASVLITASSSSAFSVDPIGTVNAIIALALLSATDMLVEPNKNIYMSYSNFNLLRNALMFNSNSYFQYNNQDGSVAEFKMSNFFGTGFDVIAVSGLNGSSRIVATFAKNIVYGVDLENDQDKFEVFYDKYRDLVLFRAKWKQGAKIAFPAQVVLHKGGAY